MFRYEKVVGCRRTTSSQHSQLPVPAHCHRAVKGFTSEPCFCVGFEYIYIYIYRVIPMTMHAVVDGKVEVAHLLLMSKLE